jgi:dihydrofolate reductase
VRLVATVHVTLDGVMEAPEEWSFEFFDEESERHSLDELVAADALLMGRVTYEGFLEYWPSATGAIAERMNALPKYVVSSTLKEVDWNNSTLIASDVASQIRGLKNQPGGDILLLASADLANSLRAEKLIDEYRIWVDPIVHGRGKRYFADRGEPTILQLTDTKTLSSGIVLTYHPPER